MRLSEFRRLSFWLAVGLSAMLWSILLSSCESIKYVPVETVRTDSVYNTVYRRDSIYMRDSVYVLDKGIPSINSGINTYLWIKSSMTRFISKGQTVFRSLTRWRRN